MKEDVKTLCKKIQHGSAEYEQTVALRHRILREPLGLHFSQEELATEKNSFHLTCWIADKLVACVVLKPLTEKKIRLRQFAVSGEFQGQGIGRFLVRYAELFVGELGCDEIVLHARESAVGFYEKLGYAKEGERFAEVTLLHYTMYKVIGS